MATIKFHLVASAPTAAVLAFIPHGATVYIKGALRFKVVVGGYVRVLGASVDAASSEQTIYSPRGYSLLGIEATHDNQNPDTFEGDEAEKSFTWTAELVAMAREKAARHQCVTVVMKRVDEKWLEFVSRRFRLSANNATAVSLFGADDKCDSTHLETLLDVKFYGVGTKDLCEPPGRIFKESAQWETAVKSAALYNENSEYAGCFLPSHAPFFGLVLIDQVINLIYCGNH